MGLDSQARSGLECIMANVKKGQTVSAPEWWKHLKWCKRVFWKKQRKAFIREIRKEVEGKK